MKAGYLFVLADDFIWIMCPHDSDEALAAELVWNNNMNTHMRDSSNVCFQ